MRSFIRERKLHAGDYVEVDIYSRTQTQEVANRRTRRRKHKVSRPAQNNLNEKNSKRYARLLMHANFSDGDYFVTLTYSAKNLPESPDKGKKDIDRFLRSLRTKYKKVGKEVKYMWFTSYQLDSNTGYVKRIHHHLVLNNAISRDEVERCWSYGRGKNKQKLGRTESKVIQSDSDGIQALANYLTNQEKWIDRQWKKGEKRWSSSKNLKKPYETRNDHKFSKKKVEKMVISTDLGEEKLLKMYPGYRVIGEIKANYYEENGWYIHIELMKNN
ncbi:rolling circle replication-associated protein [Enterococcus innesii]|jgi:hypothetical protein|uniref:rolling circle replication-associated protein n=1 Tax=Enterococcus innesii TaxID=2839759 RepID=UPI003DA345AB